MSSEHSSHHNQEDVGLKDIVVGAVLFLIFCYLLKGLLDVVVPGLLKPETLTQIIISGMMFLLVWALIGQTLFKPYLELAEEREARTDGFQKKALDVRKAETALLAEIDEQMRKARLEGISQRDQIVGEAKQQAQLIIEAAQSAAAEGLQKASEEIAGLKAKAQGELPEETQKLALLVKNRVLCSESGHVVH